MRRTKPGQKTDSKQSEYRQKTGVREMEIYIMQTGKRELKPNFLLLVLLNTLNII